MIPTNGFVTLLSGLSLIIAQKIWINDVPEYSLLRPCAEGPLSKIVRGMVSGCGDGNAITSHSCFCTESSSKFYNVIATDVSKACNGTIKQVVTALEVFQSYCEIGTTVIPTLVSKSVSSSSTTGSPNTPATESSTSATPSPTPVAPITSSTSTFSSAPTQVPSPASGVSPGAKAGIALGTIGIVLISGSVAFFFFFVRPHNRRASEHANCHRRLCLPHNDDQGWPTTVNQFQDPQSINSSYPHSAISTMDMSPEHKSVPYMQNTVSSTAQASPIQTWGVSRGNRSRGSTPISQTMPITELPAGNRFHLSKCTEMP